MYNYVAYILIISIFVGVYSALPRGSVSKRKREANFFRRYDEDQQLLGKYIFHSLFHLHDLITYSMSLSPPPLALPLHRPLSHLPLPLPSSPLSPSPFNAFLFRCAWIHFVKLCSFVLIISVFAFPGVCSSLSLGSVRRRRRKVS